MSQDIFDSIDPSISGTDLAGVLNDFKDAVVSGLSGTSRPTELDPGGAWIDTTNAPTSWTYKIWTGTDDVSVFTVDLSSGLASVGAASDSFQIKKISADAVGPFLELIKQRVASNGQVLDGDVVGEIRIVGRTNSATNPVVAKIIWTASDDQTTSAYGGSLGFHATPDGTATLTEHMRFIAGQVETIVPHKLNSEVLVSQNVATTATIVQLSAAKIVVEMTGSTATDIQGINATHDSKVITIHNRSSANVTLKHQNGSASAADRIKLPNDADHIIGPESTATLYYCTTDTLWKLLSTSDRVSGFTRETFYGAIQTWTAPATVTSVRVRAVSPNFGGVTGRVGMIDQLRNAYAWGINNNGQVGDGSVTPKSSPVAVLGGLSFIKKTAQTFSGLGSTLGIASTGAAYGWGRNASGQIGDNSSVDKSSPVAVVGGLRFTDLELCNTTAFGITTSGLAYTWGNNTRGQLGNGNVTGTSSPGAVLGGHRFLKLVPITGVNQDVAVVGLNKSGAAYAWGYNVNGNLGVGDVTPRSSPVAVLGGLTFSDIHGGATSSRYFFVGLNASGAAYAWGSNTNSNLGVGDQTPRSSPVAVLGGLTFSRLYVHNGSETVFGITTSGALYAWGDNTQGVLGVGDNTNRSSPVAVLGGLTFTKVFPYKNTAMAITADGTLYAWGLNSNGQLGLADVVSRSSPVAVLGGLKFTEVFYGDGPNDSYSVFGISTDGALYAWGNNTNGSLGVGDVVPRSSPVAVLGAFAPNAVEPNQTVDLTVVGGTSYTILTGAIGAVGNNTVGNDVYKIELEYLI